MHVDLNVSMEIEETLREQLGDDLAQFVREALAVEAYRTGKLSLGQFAGMLGITRYDADGFLKQRGIMLEMSVDEFEGELASLKELVER